MTICNACGEKKSWRYHVLDEDLKSFFITFCNSFHLSVNSREIYYCHSCTGIIRRTADYLEKLKKNLSCGDRYITPHSP